MHCSFFLKKTMKLTEKLSDLEVIINTLQQKNLVYNGSFLLFSNQQLIDNKLIYNHPDGWIYENKGENSNIELQGSACVITVNSTSENSMIFKQHLNEFPRWQEHLINKTVTANIVISAKQNTLVSFSLTDGVNEYLINKVISNNQECVTIKIDKIDILAKNLVLSIKCNVNNAVITIHKVYANIGNVALENLPLMVDNVIGERKQYISTETAPVKELSLCNESIALNEKYTRLNSVLNNRFGSNNGYSLLPDIRGLFSRGWNNGSNIDKEAKNRTQIGNNEVLGDLVGTEEQENFLLHNHELKFGTRNITLQPGSTPAIVIDQISNNDSTKDTGGKENNPINFSELYTITWA